MARQKNQSWILPERVTTWEEANIALLMDIRDEFQTLNRILTCPNFIDIPRRLTRIRESVERTDKRLAKKIKLK